MDGDYIIFQYLKIYYIAKNSKKQAYSVF